MSTSRVAAVQLRPPDVSGAVAGERTSTRSAVSADIAARRAAPRRREEDPRRPPQPASLLRDLEARIIGVLGCSNSRSSRSGQAFASHRIPGRQPGNERARVELEAGVVAAVDLETVVAFHDPPDRCDTCSEISHSRGRLNQLFGVRNGACSRWTARQARVVSLVPITTEAIALCHGRASVPRTGAPPAGLEVALSKNPDRAAIAALRPTWW